MHFSTILSTFSEHLFFAEQFSIWLLTPLALFCLNSKQTMIIIKQTLIEEWGIESTWGGSLTSIPSMENPILYRFTSHENPEYTSYTGLIKNFKQRGTDHGEN